MSEIRVSAERLREARVYLGFTRDEVSGAMKRERRWVDDIEHGRQRVTGEELRKLSRLYRRPVGWLCGETTFQPDPEMLRQVENLTEGDREAVLDFAEFLEGAGPPAKPPREAREKAVRAQLEDRMTEPTIYPVGHRFTDSEGTERVKTRWEFNAFVTQEGATASAVNLGSAGTIWYIWRLEDGSYDHTAVSRPTGPGHPAELVETITIKGYGQRKKAVPHG